MPQAHLIERGLDLKTIQVPRPAATRSFRGRAKHKNGERLPVAGVRKRAPRNPKLIEREFDTDEQALNLSAPLAEPDRLGSARIRRPEVGRQTRLLALRRCRCRSSSSCRASTGRRLDRPAPPRNEGQGASCPTRERLTVGTRLLSVFVNHVPEFSAVHAPRGLDQTPRANYP